MNKENYTNYIAGLKSRKNELLDNMKDYQDKYDNYDRKAKEVEANRQKAFNDENLKEYKKLNDELFELNSLRDMAKAKLEENKLQALTLDEVKEIRNTLQNNLYNAEYSIYGKILDLFDELEKASTELQEMYLESNRIYESIRKFNKETSKSIAYQGINYTQALRPFLKKNYNPLKRMEEKSISND